MARKRSVPRRRGYLHYILHDIEQHHLFFLRQSLRFMYGTYNSRAEFWAVLGSLFFGLPIGAAQRPSEEKEKEILSTYTVEELRRLQDWFSRDFQRSMERLSRGEVLRVKGPLVHIVKTKLPSGEEVFWAGPAMPRISSIRDMQKELDGLLLWSLSNLRVKAILPCKQCQKYFFRSDQREAEYCSQPCRLQAIKLRRKGKKGHREKTAKRG